jgi:hypothetical protein
MYRTARLSGILTVLTAITAIPQNPASSGAISGTVVDERGRPVPRATVSYSKHAEYARDVNGRLRVREPGFSATITAEADGRFTIAGLRGGTYGVCALPGGPTQLGSCDWDPVPATTLAPGGIIQNVTRVIHDGSLLTIRVADPGGKIVLPDARGNVAARERRFFVGVSSDSGRYRKVDLVSNAPGQYVFKVTIPRRRPVRLFVDSDLSVTEASGRSVETKQRSSQQVSPAGADQLALDLRVN